MDEQPTMSEIEKRDAILDTLERVRADLVEVGKRTALRLAAEHGQVTSVMVLLQMRDDGYGSALDSVDNRWAGCLFRDGGWERVGYEPVGSHGRPCAVWRRKEG